MLTRTHCETGTELQLRDGIFREDVGSASRPGYRHRELRLGLAGCGYWGRKILRNLQFTSGCEVLRVADPDPDARAFALAECSAAKISTGFAALTEDQDINAVVIATSPATHFALAEQALMAGKHVLIEKPIAATLREAELLVRIADDQALVLMVDHTFRYSPAVEEVRRLVAADAIGEPRHVEAVRCAFGRFTAEINVVWDNAIHDFSILAYVLGEQPVSLSARGGMKGLCGQEAVAHIDLEYGNGLTAHVHASWLSPKKVRWLTITGDKGTIIYEDGDLGPSVSTYLIDDGSPLETMRPSVSNIDHVEPLAQVVSCFRDTVLGRREAACNRREILPLMRILEAASRSMICGGAVQQV